MGVYGTAIYGSSTYGTGTPPPPPPDSQYARHFAGDGVDLLRLAYGTPINFSGGFSIAVLMQHEQRSSPGYASPIQSIVGGSLHAGLMINPTGQPAMNVQGGGLSVTSAPFTVPLNEWIILAATKAAGTSTPTFFIYRFATNTWEWTIGDFAIDSPAATADRFNVGPNPFKGLIATAGVWNQALTIAQVQQLSTNHETDDWVNFTVAPSAVWDLNQSTTFLPVLDLIDDSDQIGLAGTRADVVVIDWQFGGTPPPPPPEEGPGYGDGQYGGGTYGELLAAPTEPPPPEIEPEFFPTFNILQPPRIWRFILADSNTLQNIGEIFSPNVSLDLALNRAGSANFSLALNSEIANYVDNITTCLKAYRKDQLIWSGMVWNTEDILNEDRLDVNCIGWFEQLNHRILRYEKKYENDAWTGGSIALNLLAVANGQHIGALSTASPDGDGDLIPTKLIIGTSTDAQIRNRNYPRWQNIGQAITELSSIENGIDWWIDPETRAFNAYSSSLGSALRQDRPEAQFGYNWGPNNLRTFTRQIDGSELINQIHAWGPYGLATAVNPFSALVYGLHEDQVNLSELKNDDLLQAFANGEISVKSVPRTLYRMNPFPYDGTGRVPEPFVDYRIGDQVHFTAKYGDRINIERQAVRVYGIRLSVDAEGNENVDDLQLSPN